MGNQQDKRTGYAGAISLWRYQGRQPWETSRVMVLANSVLLSVLFIGLSNLNSLPGAWILPFFPGAGLIICLVWLPLVSRGYDLHKYFVLKARELEQSLDWPVDTVERGGEFLNDGKTKADGEPVELGYISQIIPGRIAFKTLPIAFTFLYLVIFGYTVSLLL